MRILIDECVDQQLQLLLPGHDCQTVGFAGFAGLKNGALLTAAEAAGFEVLLTTDKGIPFQQNLDGRGIGVLVLSARTNRLRDLELLIPEALRQLDSLSPGQVIYVS